MSNYNNRSQAPHKYDGEQREPTTELLAYLKPGKYDGTPFFGGPFTVRYNSEKGYYSLRVKKELMDLTLREVVQMMKDEANAYKQQAQAKQAAPVEELPRNKPYEPRPVKAAPKGNSNW